MKRNVLTVVIGAVLIVIFALLLFVFQVRQSEVAVVTTFGKPTAQPYDQPGAYFKWPWPIQKVYKYDQRIQNFEDKYSESLTTNGVTLLTSVYVGWKISDAGTFIQKFPGDPATVSIPNVQGQLESILRSAKSGVIGQHPLSDFVNANPQDLKFDAIEHEIEQLAQSQLQGKNYGIELEFLGFKKIGLPESVTQTVFQRMTAERQVKINQLVYDGEKQATIIKSAADRQAADTINQATAAATRIEGEGVAEAAKTLPVFQQNPELANFLLRINALQQSLNARSTLIFDERTPPFDLFTHLPTNSPSQQP
jgi:membrane protease subunit HflC